MPKGHPSTVLDPCAVEIGQRIAVRRRYLQYTQSDVASVVGFSQGYVSKWEGGRVAPSAEQIEALARELAVTVEWLLTGEVDD